MKSNKKDNTPTNGFKPLKREEMPYHEYLDYWVCKCGNFEKLLGFNASTKFGDLISPIGAKYCRCERCGRVIEAKSHTIIGINLSPIRGRF
jgi:hypothetical protein